MAQTVPIKRVPEDHSNIDVVAVYNPMKEDFTHKFDGKPLTVEAKSQKAFTENVAVHLARHMAQRIVNVVAGAEREEIMKDLDKNEKVVVAMKPYPRFRDRVARVAKQLVLVADQEAPKTEDIEASASEDSSRVARKTATKKTTKKTTKTTKKTTK